MLQPVVDSCIFFRAAEVFAPKKINSGWREEFKSQRDEHGCVKNESFNWIQDFVMPTTTSFSTYKKKIFRTSANLISWPNAHNFLVKSTFDIFAINEAQHNTFSSPKTFENWKMSNAMRNLILIERFWVNSQHMMCLVLEDIEIFFLVPRTPIISRFGWKMSRQ